jgi:RNA polymerase sigma-70 factor (ECF subfamily)
MAIAWRRLADVPRDDPRPWLLATARNLLLAEWRQRSSSVTTDPDTGDERRVGFDPAPELRALDPSLLAALRSLSVDDREALLLIAWEDLSPALAAKALGVNQTAFRVRLHRARRRLREALATAKDTHPSMHSLEVERR